MLLIRRALIGIAGRDGNAVHAHRHHVVEERRDPLRLRRCRTAWQLMMVRKPRALRRGDRRHRAVVDAVLADRDVVLLARAVQVHRPGEPLARLEQVHLLFQQQRVGADDDELLARDGALTICSISRCSSGSPPAITTTGRAALVDRLHAFGDRQALVQDLRRIVDLAAAGAGQVAAEQRLQHQHQRVALAPEQMLLHHIGADAERLVQRHGHASGSSTRRPVPAGSGSARPPPRRPGWKCRSRRTGATRPARPAPASRAPTRRR